MGEIRILLVEDDHEIRETVGEILEEEGYVVTTATTGRDALDKLKAAATLPSIILLDLMMPVMDGWAFRREQRNDPALAPIPVIILTAGSITENMATLEATDLLRKPFDMDVLLEKIRKVFDMRTT